MRPRGKLSHHTIPPLHYERVKRYRFGEFSSFSNPFNSVSLSQTCRSTFSIQADMNQVARKVSLYKLGKYIDNASRVFGEPAVILRKIDKVASLKFNRPRFFNCIDGSVITPGVGFLSKIIQEKSTNMLTIEGSNQKNKNHAFTTGGDLLMGLNIIYRKEKTDIISTEERLYLVNIYRAQHYLHKLGKDIPVISMMDGVSMGSGVLFGLNSTFSVATERTVWSIPEVTIGGMPDVGVIYHMNNLPNHLGIF